MRQFFVGRIAVFVFINAPNFLCTKLFYAADFFYVQKIVRTKLLSEKIYVYGTCVPFPSLRSEAKKNYIFFVK